MKIKHKTAKNGGIIGIASFTESLLAPLPFLSCSWGTIVGSGTWNPENGVAVKLIDEIEPLRITELKHSESSLMLSRRFPRLWESCNRREWFDGLFRGSCNVPSSLVGVFSVYKASSVLLFKPVLLSSLVSGQASEMIVPIVGTEDNSMTDYYRKLRHYGRLVEISAGDFVYWKRNNVMTSLLCYTNVFPAPFNDGIYFIFHMLTIVYLHDNKIKNNDPSRKAHWGFWQISLILSVSLSRIFTTLERYLIVGDLARREHGMNFGSHDIHRQLLFTRATFKKDS